MTPVNAREPLLRRAALAALARVGEGVPADRALRRALKAAAGLDDGERREVSDRVFRVAAFKARLDHLLGRPGSWEERLDADLAERRGEAAAASWPAEPAERLAAERSFPRWLARALVAQYGAAEADALCAALNAPAPLFLRVNTAHTTRDALAARLAAEGARTEPCPLAPHALRALGRVNVYGSPAWQEGLFEVQDAGSQAVAALAEAPGGEVLDLCAGAGGKALALAESARRVFAHDVDARKLADLRLRAARARARNVELLAPGSAPPPADAVLVDAPCSSVGALRRGPDARWRLDEAEVAALPQLQLELLARGAACVRPGGALVYATCTVLAAEDEEVAAAFERAHPTFRRERELVLLPHREGCDGFYAVRWSRS